MKVKEDFFSFGTFQLNDGNHARFWEDKWMGNFSLKDQFPQLYNLVRRKNTMVASVFSIVSLNVPFRGGLVEQYRVQWMNLVAQIAHVRLNNKMDTFLWNLTSRGIFSVQSIYNNLLANDNVVTNKDIWKIKMPLKIKVFMWYLCRGVTLTKDNLVKSNWKGNANCSFCGRKETIDHFFFHCHYAKNLWQLFQIQCGVRHPHNVTHLFGSWLDGREVMRRMLLLVVSAMC